MWWLVTAVVLVAIVATYVTWIAARLERLHRRAADATLALHGRLDRRAKTALLLAEERGAEIGRHAEALRAAAFATLDVRQTEREPAENDLTLVLRRLPLPPEDPAWATVRKANRQLAIARQVHTDVVRDALALRSRRLVRLLRLSRKLDRPAYFNMDDPN